jgi:3-oxoacyl-[acyl-carrier-protein] synthase III
LEAFYQKKDAPMKIGIVSYGLYFPKDIETADDLANRAGLSLDDVIALGIKRKFLPSPSDQPVSMAAKAAERAFECAGGIQPADIDVVIWTGEEYKDYIAQTASIRLQEETGCCNAWAFDLVGQGVTSIVGLRMARDLMIGDESVNAVLLAGGTRNIDLVDYTNPDTRFLLAASASGGAIILKRGYPANLIVDTDLMVDFDMADEVYVPGGGTEIPFRPDNLSSKLMFFQAMNPERLSLYLDKRWPKALTEVVQRVSSGRSPDYVALRHLSAKDRQRILKELNMKFEQSMELNEWGHHGPNDIIISLDLGLRDNIIQDGSRVVLASGGIGFTYAAALVQWGAAV